VKKKKMKAESTTVGAHRSCLQTAKNLAMVKRCALSVLLGIRSTDLFAKALRLYDLSRSPKLCLAPAQRLAHGWRN
jgi:hypothetical protein